MYGNGHQQVPQKLIRLKKINNFEILFRQRLEL